MEDANSSPTNNVSPHRPLRRYPPRMWRMIRLRNGDYAEGNIDKREGTFIEGDQIVNILSAQAYDVTGLRNPYLGLQPFTYVHRDTFKGRDDYIAVALDKLVQYRQQVLLFVTGASGSGKSSFVQAGLLPKLEEYYAERHIQVRYVVLRPTHEPMEALQHALLGLCIAEPDQADAEHLYLSLSAGTSENQRNVIILDQFEEVFAPDCHAAQRDMLLGFLAGLPALKQLRTHIIVTLRHDFLPDLFSKRELYHHVKRGIDLRQMSKKHLREAIEFPLQHLYPDKRFEPELVTRLVMESHHTATLLPLLQVTLSQLWNSGSLTLASFLRPVDEGGCAGSIGGALQYRANACQDFTDYLSETPHINRAAADSHEIMAIFLDLINVSLGGRTQATTHELIISRDVRRRQPLTALLRGSSEQSNRRRLIYELCEARLLSASALPSLIISQNDSTAHSVQINQDAVDDRTMLDESISIDIIHESLISYWERLRLAVDAHREQLEQRERFRLALSEWQAKEKKADYLLIGVRLAEAEDLRQRDDIVFQELFASEFLESSLAQREREHKHEVALIEARAVAEQVAKEEAEARADANWRALEATKQQINAATSARRRAWALITLLLTLLGTGLVRLTYLEWLRWNAANSVSLQGLPGMNVRMEATEVTNYRFQQCVHSGTCTAPPALVNKYYGITGGELLPVSGVDGIQAAIFCKWIGRRLPRYSEWQAALTPQSHWPEDAIPALIANSNLDHDAPGIEPELAQVAGKGRDTPDGIYDLYGSLWELTSTEWIENQTIGKPWNGEAETAPARLVAAGGSFKDTESAIDTFKRPLISNRTDDIGFRCVQES